MITSVVAAVIFGAVRDYPALLSNRAETADSSKRRNSDVRHDFCTVFRNRDFWLISLLCFSWFGSFIGVQGLWAGPYLMEVHGFSGKEAGNVLAMIAVGFIFGAPLLGHMSDRIRSRKLVIFWGLLGYTGAFFSLIMIADSIDMWTLYLVFFGFGFFGASGIISYAQVKELFPMRISGTVMASANFFAMAGAALFQHLMGAVIQRYSRGTHGYAQEGYSAVFLIGALIMIITLVFYQLTLDTHAEHVDAASQCDCCGK
jgi:sugar phosphate permease